MGAQSQKALWFLRAEGLFAQAASARCLCPRTTQLAGKPQLTPSSRTPSDGKASPSPGHLFQPLMAIHTIYKNRERKGLKFIGERHVCVLPDTQPLSGRCRHGTVRQGCSCVWVVSVVPSTLASPPAHLLPSRRLVPTVFPPATCHLLVMSPPPSPDTSQCHQHLESLMASLPSSAAAPAWLPRELLIPKDFPAEEFPNPQSTSLHLEPPAEGLQIGGTGSNSVP